MERRSSRPRDFQRRPPTRAQRRTTSRPASGPRPDLVAAWAVALGIFLILVASATSQGATGGASLPETGGAGQPPTQSGDPAAVALARQKLGLPVGGIASAAANRSVALRMPTAIATWYGPGLYGRRTACGVVLRRATIGVAHRRLPCGTEVVFYYRGIFQRVPVIDRGPYARGVSWDLTSAAARSLGLGRTARVRLVH